MQHESVSRSLYMPSLSCVWLISTFDCNSSRDWFARHNLMPLDEYRFEELTSGPVLFSLSGMVAWWWLGAQTQRY